ncbi:preprotein translocase subunit SecG [Enterobacteriaceae endosymbiont of Donacia tomentosa]|uniref:preprotein translocase subunit SecG n=1 Tax=Enterobacteriaceae endosymbiont of Donacia tomentosa TaxID=2675787 RepID=UPI00144A2162|nr:preprotein translocase subunit SecG [Enterobacteriaceae endosymbiont of Donacia tomentosa]QJC31744.1 preprotein translocase subunit SecG [Enterobacteriaceae endosymbiont of Donacia tomentosa]
MYKFLLILFIFISIFLIVIIMLQNNDSTDISSSINNSKTPFNTNVPNKIITRCIIILTFLFFIISLILSNLNVKKYKNNIVELHKNINNSE